MTAVDPDLNREQALERSEKDLADIKFALDESAIVAITDQRGITTPAHVSKVTGESDATSTRFVLPEHGLSLDEAELSFVKQAIQRSGGNQTRAAELLGISRDQLRYRLKKLEETQVTGSET